MSDELGLINYDSGEGDEVFLGKEIGQQRPYGEDTQTLIDQEVEEESSINAIRMRKQ